MRVRACACCCRCACACLCALLLLVFAAAEHDKRAEILGGTDILLDEFEKINRESWSHTLLSPMPFLMATRYGRSSPPARHLAPRNDRFFMSTRYGKRSDMSLSAGGGAVGARGEAGGALVCEFTGVFPLYRCRHKLLYHKKSAEEVGEREEE